MAAKKSTYTGVPGLNKALRSIPKHASKQLREASKAIAQDIAARASSRARGRGGVAQHVADSIRAGSDRVPVVRLGVGPNGGPALGAEFGGRGRPTTQQFLPHLGNVGYFLWPTVRERGDEIQDAYSEALDDALDKVK